MLNKLLSTIPDADALDLTDLFFVEQGGNSRKTDGSALLDMIVESGSNANGRYTRFANGFQVCHHTHDDTATGWTTATGSFYRRDGSNYNWTFPAEFSEPPVVIPNVQYGSDIIMGARNRSAPSTTSVNIQTWAAASLSGGSPKFISMFAVGPWL